MTWLTDPLSSEFVLRALAELLLLAPLAGALGVWLVLRGMSYGAESLAHGMLPGLVLAVLAGVPLALGGAGGLLVAALAIALVGRVPRLDGDVATSVVVSGLLGLGVLLALARQTPAGLGELLFGDVLAVSDGDLALTALAAAVMVAALTVAHPLLLAVTFDPGAAAQLGPRAARCDLLVAALLALATLAAVQALGSLLVVALLVGPAATARLVCRRIVPAMLVATAVAALAACAGLLLSYHAETGAGASVTCAVVVAYALARTGRALGAARRREAQALHAEAPA